MIIRAALQIQQDQRISPQHYQSTVFWGLFFNNYFYFQTVPVQILPFDFGEEPINSGEFATVQCVVSKGDFPISFTWKHNDKELDQSLGVTVSNTNRRISTLSIELVQAVHMGNYSCTAHNPAGETTHSAELNVNGNFNQQYVRLL